MQNALNDKIPKHWEEISIFTKILPEKEQIRQICDSLIRIRDFFPDPDPGAEKIPDPPGFGSSLELFYPPLPLR